jgi:hypothetical protein
VTDANAENGKASVLAMPMAANSVTYIVNCKQMVSTSAGSGPFTFTPP